MAKISPTIPFSNTLGDYSVYKMQGFEKLIVRRRHGPSKEQLKKEKRYEKFRFWQNEFAGASKGSQQIQRAISSIKHLKDFSFGGYLQKSVSSCRSRKLSMPWVPGPYSFLNKEAF